jgi:vesicle-fusing ATPase
MRRTLSFSSRLRAASVNAANASCSSSSSSSATTTFQQQQQRRQNLRRRGWEEKSISTSTFQNYGYSFGVIGGGTPSEITPIDDFMDKKEKPKAKPMKRAATAQGTAQTEASDNRIGRGSANTIKEKPKDERVGQTHLLDILKREKEKSSGIEGDIEGEKKRNMPSFAFCGVGGLDDHFATLFRRVFASRMIDPAVAKKMELEHVRGVLLHGPPGTGKTLVAKALGELLHAHPPKIVNGPEILQRFVGQSEENIRGLFADAELEYKIRGDESKLHVIVFDEIDAVCKARGSGGVTASVVHDNVVNQLLTKLDGMRTLNNVLVVGITNRRDLLDKALLRPGRLELQLEIGLPDAYGRLQILGIHTKSMKESGTLSECVDLERLAQMTENHSGAELKGLVRAATSHALARHLGMGTEDVEVKDASSSSEEKNPKVTMGDFVSAMKEFVSAMKQDAKEVANIVPENFVQLEKQTEAFDRLTETLVTLRDSGGGKNDGHNVSGIAQTIVQVRGARNSGKTTLACKAVTDAKYPHARIISAHDILKKVEDPSLTASSVVYAIKNAFDDAAKGKLSAIIIDDLDVLLGVDRATGRIPDANKEMARVVLEMIASAPERGRKLAVIVTTNSSSSEERDIINSIEIDENDASLFEDYDDEEDDYTELDFLLSEYVSRTIDVLPDDTKSACDTILMAQGLPSYLSASCLEFSEHGSETGSKLPTGKLMKMVQHAKESIGNEKIEANVREIFRKSMKVAANIVV